MADGKKPNGDGDDRPRNRKRENPGDLELADDYFKFDGDSGKIKIMTAAGNTFSFTVHGSYTIGTLKTHIRSRFSTTKIPRNEKYTEGDEHELMFDRKVLDNIDTFADLRIKKQSTLTLLLKKPMEVFVNILTGKTKTNTKTKTISLSVKRRSNTVRDVKSEIQRMEQIPVNEQVLIFNQMVLADHSNLLNFRINEKSTITLMRKSTGFVEVFIKNLLTEETFTLRVKLSYTISYVKAILQSMLQIPCDEQELIFNEMVLGDNSCNLSTSTSVRNRRLHLCVKDSCMKIFIKTYLLTEQQTIALAVKPSYTISYIKASIQPKLRIPCDEQVLSFNEMVLDNTSTLADFQINAESTLTVRRKSLGLVMMHISIKTAKGEITTLEVKPSDTIDFVKSKIQDQLDIPHDEQELIFNEMVLDNKSTLADFDINKESTLTLTRISWGCHMHIFIKTLAGKTITVKVIPTELVHNVKSRIFYSEDIKNTCGTEYDIRLMFNGKQLDGSLTLSDYHIHNESTVHIMDE